MMGDLLLSSLRPTSPPTPPPPSQRPAWTLDLDQGTTQRWRLRDTTFHPWHLHETPVQITKLPACTSVTNMWKVQNM